MYRAVIGLSAALALSPVPTVGAAKGILQSVGELHCVARLADTGAPEKVDLECRLQRTGSETMIRSYNGEIFGSDLWLVDPGPVRLVWQVLAPREDVGPEALEGTYDIVTRHDYELAASDQNILFGGRSDTIALRLLVPAVDGISPATTLKLQTALFGGRDNSG